MGFDKCFNGFKEYGVDLKISPSVNNKMYCVKCKKKSNMKNYHKGTLKFFKRMGNGNCTKCESKINTFSAQFIIIPKSGFAVLMNWKEKHYYL